MGYLFGEIPGIQGQKESILISNFHYGEDNVVAIGDADGSSVKNFTEGNFGEFTATNNVRNGAKTELTAKNNGYVSKDYMESSNFAAFLNSPWTETEDLVWAYSNDAGGLPFFGTASTGQVVLTVPVVFKDGESVLSVKIGNKVVDVQDVKVGGAAVAPATPAPKGGQCFDKWSEDYTHIMAAVDILAQYKICTYTVVFTNEDGTKIFDTQTVEYNKNAIAPTDLELPEGQCFDSWDGTYTSVKSDLTIKAKTAPCTYTVKFTDEAGTKVFKTQTVEYNKNATAPTDLELPEGKCFDSWDGTYTNVKSDLTIKAKTAPCTYTVEFTDDAGTKVFKKQTVEYGNDATAPAELDLPEGQCFDSWDGIFTNVKADLTVKVKTKACGNSSSSSSGNTSESSSSSSAGNGGNSSSAGHGNASSSSAGNGKYSSGGSVNDESSSSSTEHKKYLLDIAEPTATQDGKALRMEFDNQLANMSEKVDCHIQVVSEAGIYLDTVVDGKTVGGVKNGTWRLDPAPAGEYTVFITLKDGVDSIPYQKTFKSIEKRELATNSWQTLSLYAFCQNKGEECLSDLEERFARKLNNRAAEQCEEMKSEVKRGNAPDNDQFYREMDEVCAQANGSDVSTSIFWWDETNPVGDYWQYRKFSVDDKFDSTRGYWYGPINSEPLVMSLETPDMKDEIVWRLENKFSGWNLVANPFGWYVKIPKEKGFQFCQWDSEASTYVESDTLRPYEAIWVHTEKPMTYRIPLKAAIVFEEEKGKKSLNKNAAPDDWNLRVVLADNNGKRDSWNELAAGKTASTLGEPPAGMGDRVNLSIVDGKKRLVKSVKKNADDLEWDLEVSATTMRDGHLSFEGLESVWAKGLRVYATVDNETVEIAKDRPLDVTLSSKAKNISVRVTKSAVVSEVSKNLLKGLRVNQTPNVLNVGFDAASKLAGAKVKISVVGIDGRIVATGKSTVNAGTNAISMKMPKQGVYFVKVKVGSLSAVTRVMVR